MNYLIKSFKKIVNTSTFTVPLYQTPIVGKGTEGWQNTLVLIEKLKSKWWRWYCE